MDDQIVAGARDAAKELGYQIVSASVDHRQDGGSAYGFGFVAPGGQARVDFLVNEADIVRFGLTLRDDARWEILDVLREPGSDS